MGICDGRVVIVTGAGRGIGREHALAFAAEGAKVVVNDLGAGIDGRDVGEHPAEQVVAEIKAAGGEAVVNGNDISSWDGARELVQQAIDTFGGLDVLVNNAGFLRDKMLVGMSEEEWDKVTTVHLKGHFAPLRHAAAHWRERAKAGEEVVISMTIVPGRADSKMPPSPNITCSTSEGYPTMVITTSASRTASAIDPAHTAPVASAVASAFSIERLQTVTGYPFWRSRATMDFPMTPVPIKPMR